MKLLCECGSFLCRELIEVADELEAADAHGKGLVFIAEACKRGPEPTDRLIEERDGYALYRDSLSSS